MKTIENKPQSDMEKKFATYGATGGRRSSGSMVSANAGSSNTFKNAA
jgi:hypothetical protein